MLSRHLYALPLLGLLAACGDGGLWEGPISRVLGDEADSPAINPWWDASQQAVSTFSVDVDTASYARVRRALRDGRRPDPVEVRPEEIINYLDFADPGPPRGHPHPLALTAELGPAPFAPEAMGTRARLLRVHVAAEAVPESERRPANLVFLIDTSGSMRGAGRLQLVKYALTHLLDRLGPDDSLSVVTYAGEERLLFPPTPIRDKTTIADALLDLGAGGGTNGAGGIRLAYAQAQAAFRPEGINRVILCTDGDFNVGITGEDLVRFAEARAAEGIRLTGLGFGDGNYRDDFMEELTNRADGNYAYIDTPNEALRVLGERLVSTLQVVAEDVKIQVEMDPAVVGRYRLIGFENRVLANESFEDDAADAGDVGAGHHITAFYEVELREGASGAAAEVRLRYQPAGGGASQLITATPDEGAEPSAAFRAGAAIAEWAEILRESPHAEGRRLGEVRRALEASLGRAPLELELLDLVRVSQAL